MTAYCIAISILIRFMSLYPQVQEVDMPAMSTDACDYSGVAIAR